MISLYLQYYKIYSAGTKPEPINQNAITVMNRGDNLSHSGRLLLATYMYARGMEIEDIIELQNNSII